MKVLKLPDAGDLRLQTLKSNIAEPGQLLVVQPKKIVTYATRSTRLVVDCVQDSATCCNRLYGDGKASKIVCIFLSCRACHCSWGY
jgi:hypothetical protein